MKKGTILYVVNCESDYDENDIKKAVNNLQIDADLIETVYSRSDNYDVMDAWWALTRRGMKEIICRFAEITINSGLKLTGRELRLCG
ncbi:MAG: hypothetical protein J7L16_09630 [Deltaproteobacteria bacterium]|nr:hypothetical protein [Deltaproteobacteria bacterium]